MIGVSDPTTPRGAKIQLRNLSRRFGGQAAVDGISLDVPAGSFVSLLGPSGSGKTTTLNLIAGFLTPDAGDILFDDRSVADVPPHHRDIGMVFQSYALFPHLTVAHNVAFPLRMRTRLAKADIERRVAETLALVRMEDYGGRYPRQLSGGQQQRVAMARALVSHPRLLLMDEPLGALDKKLRDQMQFEIKRIHRSVGTTFIYVTHDQSEALTMSDLVVLMHRGRIAQTGTPRELYTEPANVFVADFIGDSNLLNGRVTAIEGDSHGRARRRRGRSWFPGAATSRMRRANGSRWCCGLKISRCRPQARLHPQVCQARSPRSAIRATAAGSASRLVARPSRSRCRRILRSRCSLDRRSSCPGSRAPHAC